MAAANEIPLNVVYMAAMHYLIAKHVDDINDPSPLWEDRFEPAAMEEAVRVAWQLRDEVLAINPTCPPSERSHTKRSVLKIDPNWDGKVTITRERR